jgi:hypothetical protein
LHTFSASHCSSSHTSIAQQQPNKKPSTTMARSRNLNTTSRRRPRLASANARLREEEATRNLNTASRCRRLPR